MKWNECFEHYQYNSLIKNDMKGKRTLTIQMFEEDGKIPEELEEVYISKLKDEMFLVIRIREGVDVTSMCNKWDSKILAFINFGCLPGETKRQTERIKYNVTQILLHEKIADKQLEKSTSVSRKIFLSCSSDNELDDKDKLLLPFWYDEFDGITLKPERENELNRLLPIGKDMDFLKEKRKKIRKNPNINEKQLNFSIEELDLVKGWLEADDIRVDNN